MISYSPLWKLLIDKKMTKTQLREKANFSMQTLASMGKNKYISMEIIDKICNALDCEISDIIKHEK